MKMKNMTLGCSRRNDVDNASGAINVFYAPLSNQSKKNPSCSTSHLFLNTSSLLILQNTQS